MTRYKKGEFKIKMRPDLVGNGIRQGYICGPLAIHAGSWDITHIPSGLWVSRGSNRLKDAKAIVEAILPLADWELIDPLKPLSEEQRHRIQKIIRRLQ